MGFVVREKNKQILNYSELIELHTIKRRRRSKKKIHELSIVEATVLNWIENKQCAKERDGNYNIQITYTYSSIDFFNFFSLLLLLLTVLFDLITITMINRAKSKLNTHHTDSIEWLENE